jgi:hypothetical protein
MNTRFFIANLLILTLFFTSCTKDDPKDPNESLNDKIVNVSWNVRSFTADGVETMQVLYNSMEINFTKEDKNNGSTRWRLINTAGQASNLDGKYTIRNQGKEIDVDGDLFDITVDGQKLLLSGNVDGERWLIDARK